MLMFFPEIYPDEIIFSFISRYHKLCGNGSIYETLDDLFDNHEILPLTMFPSNLTILCNKLPNIMRFTLEGFLQNNTILPIFKPFIEVDDFERVKNDIVANKTKSVNGYLGLTVKASFLKIYMVKYCIECAKEDVKKYGEAYLHRQHQINCEKVCCRHKTLLKIITLSKANERRGTFNIDKYLRENNLLENENITDKNNYSSELLTEHINLSEDIEFLLKSNNSNLDLEYTYEKYINMLCEKGYTTDNGYFKQQRVGNDFKNFYSKEFLNSLNCNIDIKNKDNWICRIIQRNKKSRNPIRNMLFIRFLFGNVENFISNIPTEDIYFVNDRKTPNTSHVTRTVDEEFWERRDLDLSNQLLKIMVEIQSKEFLNRQVSLTYLVNQLKYVSYYQFSDRLPLTKSLMEKYSESREDFSIRKINYYFVKIGNSSEFSFNTVKKQLGYMKITPRIQQYITDLINRKM